MFPDELKVLLRYALSALLNLRLLEIGLGTPATGQLLFLVAAAASSSVHTPVAEVWVGVT
jgi:hypothetical protein